VSLTAALVASHRSKRFHFSGAAVPVRPTGKRSENFDQHVVATEAERSRLHRDARSRASEFVAENRASGRDGFRHGLSEKVDAGSVESWKPARFHEGPLPIHDMRVEH